MGQDPELARQEELLRKKYGENFGLPGGPGAPGGGPRPAIAALAGDAQRKKDLVAARLMSKGLGERKFFDSADASMAADKAKPKQRTVGGTLSNQGGVRRPGAVDATPSRRDSGPSAVPSRLADSSGGVSPMLAAAPLHHPAIPVSPSSESASSTDAGVQVAPPKLARPTGRRSSRLRVGEMGASEVGHVPARTEAEIARLAGGLEEWRLMERTESTASRGHSSGDVASEDSDDQCSNYTSSPDPSRASSEIPSLEEMRDLPKVVQHTAEVAAISGCRRPVSKLAMTDMSRDGSIRRSGAVDIGEPLADSSEDSQWP